MLGRLLPLAALLSVSFALYAQSTGRLSGTVYDQNEAVVVGAHVTCRGTLTGTAFEAVTNNEGIFHFPDLPIGLYEVTVTHTGFQKLVRSDIEMLTGHTVQLKLKLVVGQVSQSVEVTAEIPIVQSASSEIQTTIDNRSMKELPLNGRNPLELVALTAGADFTDVGTIAGQQDNTGITVNGLRATDNNYQLDGASFNNAHFGSAPTLPNPDTLEEFTVQSSNFSARESRAGALVQLSTRSGTNAYHGSLFEFLRNQALDARNFFDDDRAEFVRHQYGGTASGRIVRNKTFFFTSYQGTTKSGSPSPKLLTVPPESLRQGDLSLIASKNVVDPTTGQLWPGNRVPVSRFDPASVKLMQYIPVPPGDTFNIRAPQNADLTDKQFVIKIDHELTDRHRLSGRYYFDENNFQRDLGAPVGIYGDNIFRNQILSVRDTWIATPALTGVFSVSYSRTHRTQIPVSPIYNQDLTDKVPLATNLTKPELRVNIAQYLNMTAGGSLVFDPKTWGARSQFSWVRGTHLVQFGLDLERNAEFGADTSLGAGNFAFANTQTANNAIKGSTGDQFVSFLLGLPNNFTQSANDYQSLSEIKWQPWIQDDWRVRRNFTINMGVRWEPWFPAMDHHGPLPALIAGMQSKVAPDAPAGLVFSGDLRDSIFPIDWNNIAPRVGFAWDLGGSSRTVIRGGYGFYYRSAPLNLQRHAANTAAFRGLSVTLNAPGSFTDPFQKVGGSPYPFTPPKPSELANYKFPRPVTSTALDPTARTSYTQSWNFTIERRILRETSLAVSYIGNHSVKIIAGTEGNPAIYMTGATVANTDSRRIFPGIASVLVYSGWEAANFNSLQVNVTKRTRRGLSIISNYVWAKALDNGSNGTQGGATGQQRDPFNLSLDKGPADYDVAHRTNIATVYDLPRFVARQSFAHYFVNDWQMNVILTAQTGRPFTVFSGVNRSLIGISKDHADQIGDPARPAGADPLLLWFNKTAFTQNALGTFGNSGRNILRGPGKVVMNFSMFKNTRINERFTTQLRCEAFNVLNHANFANPNGTLSNVNYGKIINAADPRVVQFGMKLIF